jgi:ribose transport system permease protein
VIDSLRVSVRRASDKGILVWLLVLFLAVQASAVTEFFLTGPNLSNLGGQLVPLGLASLGQMAAVLAGMIDLSVGATARLAALLTAGLIDDEPGRVVWAILVVLAVAAVIGLANGLMVVKADFNPLIATLISFTVLRGVALAYTREPIGGVPFEVTQYLYETFLGIPYPAWGMLLLAVAVAVLLGRTRFGRSAYAVGGDEEVAHRAGVDVGWVRIRMMMLCSIFAGLAGVTLAFRQGVGDPRVAEGLELTSIVAVVVGGVSIFGGRGNVWGVVGGVMFLSVLQNAMNLQGVDPLFQGVVTGILIILAVVVFSRRDR